MRYLLFTCFLFFMFPYFCLAQQWSIGIQLGNASSAPNQTTQLFGSGNSTQNNFHYSYGISLYRSTKKQSTWRLRMNWEEINTEIISAQDMSEFFQTNFTRKTNSSQNNFTIAPGVYMETTFGKMKPRFGLEVPIRFFGINKKTVTSISSNTFAQGAEMITPQAVTEGLSEREGGSSIGLGGILGMSYKIFKGLSIAVEFIPTISYQNYENTYTTNTTQGTTTKTFFEGILVNEGIFSESNTVTNTVAQKGFRFDQHQLQVLIAYEF